MEGPGRIPVRRGGLITQARSVSLGADPRPRVAQPWLARAFFLRFASLRFRFTDGFS